MTVAPAGGANFPVLGGLLAWWLGELRSLVPASGTGRNRHRRAIILSLEGAQWRLIDLRNARPVPVMAAAQGDAEAMDNLRLQTLRLSRRGRVPVGLRLERAVCLVRELTVPANALPQIARILALDLERATPFKRADVRYGWTETAASGGGIAVEQVIAKRSLVDPALAWCREQGIPVAFVDIWRDGQTAFGADLLASDALVASPKARRSGAMTWALLAILALAGAALFQVFNQKAVALAQLEEQVAAAKARALALRQSQDASGAAAHRLEALWTLRRGRPLAIELWAEVTRLLPDTAYLSELRIDGGRLSMQGHARSAAGLVAILKRSPLLADAALISPVVFDDALGLERFEIAGRLVAGAIAGDAASEAAP